MLKLFGFLRRRPGLTLEGFSRHWSTVHRDLALHLVAPGIMRAYVQNHRDDLALDGAQPPCDGLPEVWIDDLAALSRLATCPEYLEGAYLDEPNFMDGRADTAVTRTAWRSAFRPTGAAKLMCFLRSTEGLDWEAPAPWWLPAARPLCIQRDRCLTAEELGGLSSPWRAIEASWWPTARAAAAAWEGRTPEQEARAALLIREVVVLEPPTAAG